MNSIALTHQLKTDNPVEAIAGGCGSGNGSSVSSVSGWGDTPVGIHRLVAASRYLAVHSPTIRSQAQIYQIAYQLHWGDRLRE